MSNAASRGEARAWAASAVVAMFNAMNEPLRTRARLIRQAAAAADDAAEAKVHDDGSEPTVTY